MNDSTDRPSPRSGARTIGVVWLLYFVIGILGTVLMRGIVVPGNATATATNLLAHATLFQQLQAAALFSLRMFGRVFHISFVLFGFFEMVLGYLILKSTFLPRWLGWLFIVAGVGAATFLWPPFATSIFPVILALDAAELILAVWLVVKGRAIDRWQAQSSA